MAVESGLGWTTFTVADSGASARDIRSSTTSLSFATPRGVQDVTALSQSANARLLLLADATVTPAGVFDDGSNLAHDVFKTVPSTSVARAVVITVSGQTLFSSPACTFFPTDYALTRAQSGEFTWSAPLVLANGLVPTWT